MAVVLDIIFVAVLVIFYVIGKKRGFVSTLVKTIGFFLSVYIACALCNPLGNFITNKFIRPSLVNNTCKKIESSVFAAEIDFETAQKVYDSFPGMVKKNLSKNNLSAEDIKNRVNTVTASTAKEKAEKIVDEFELPPIRKLVQIICSVVLFILSLIGVRFLSKLLNIIFKLPVLKSINRIFGGILGIGDGILAVYILAVILSALIALNNGQFLSINTNTVDSTYLFKYIYGFSPFS